MELNPAKTISQLIAAISFALDLDEGIKLYHAWRVSIFGAEIAKAILPNERKNIFYGSLLHDVGGIGLPQHLIHYLLMEAVPQERLVLIHPLIGAEITNQIPNLDAAAKLVLNHHEWLNGKGYPLGRQSEEIPQGSQIISIGDQVDIFIRSKPGQTQTELIDNLNLRRQQQFPSLLVDCTVSILESQRFFVEVTTQDGLEAMFRKIRDDVGEISVTSGIDAVGVVCEVFSQLIDTKHPYTIGHSKRVSRYSLLIALAMDLPHDDVTKIKWAGLLHDIGKLGIPRKFLDKPAGLTTDEYEKVTHHATLTRELLETITEFKEIALIAGSDHERYDGRGYPQGLKGEDIPYPARILAVADAFDAMTSDRSYRKARSADEACAEIGKNAGGQFDPLIVKEAIPVLRNLLYQPIKL